MASLQYKSNILFLAAMYSLIIVTIPWDVIRGEQFEDYLNYIARINYLEINGELHINGNNFIIDAFVHEILWGNILLGIAESTIEPELFLGMLSFVCLLSISYYVFSSTQTFFGILFLTNPIIIDFVMSQHRNALAFSLFLCVIAYDKKLIFYFVMLISMLIHSVSLLLFPSFIFCRYVVENKILRSFFMKKLSVIFVAIVLGAVISIGREVILGGLGDRRAEYSADSASFMYASFWFFILSALLILYRYKDDKVYYYVVLNLVIFAVLVLFDSYSNRFLALAYPFLIVSLYKLRKDFSLALSILLFAYQIFQWLFWFRIV